MRIALVVALVLLAPVDALLVLGVLSLSPTLVLLSEVLR